MTKSRNLISKRKLWSADEDAILQALYPCTKTAALVKLFNCGEHVIYHRAYSFNLKKSQWFKDSPMAQRMRAGDEIGKAYRFKKGQVPPNKGVKGVRYPGTEKTWFKKGQVPANIKPLYFERIDADGYVWIKVPETNPHTGAPTRFVFKQHWIWQQANGAIPDGHILHFIDGNKQNCDLSNLELITKGVNALLNQQGYANMPAEIKPAVKALAKLQHKKSTLLKELNKSTES